jgi:hypothetical protein
MLWNTEQYIIEYEKEYRQIPTNKKSRTFTMKTQLVPINRESSKESINLK